MEWVDRIRRSRAPRMECKYLLPSGVQPADKAPGYLRRLAKQTDNPLARAVASERCDAHFAHAVCSNQ